VPAPFRFARWGALAWGFAAVGPGCRRIGSGFLRPAVGTGTAGDLPPGAASGGQDQAGGGLGGLVRNRRGDTRGLRHVVDGRLERAVSLQDLYRLTPESTDKLAALLRDAPESIHEAALRRHTGMPRRRWALEGG
jgi:hypothetical protein